MTWHLTITVHVIPILFVAARVGLFGKNVIELKAESGRRSVAPYVSSVIFADVVSHIEKIDGGKGEKTTILIPRSDMYIRPVILVQGDQQYQRRHWFWGKRSEKV